MPGLLDQVRAAVERFSTAVGSRASLRLLIESLKENALFGNIVAVAKT